MSGVYYNGKVIVPFKYGEIKYADSCYIASCSYKCKGYYIYSLDGELIGNGINDYKIIEDVLYLVIDGNTYSKKNQKIVNNNQ